MKKYLEQLFKHVGSQEQDNDGKELAREKYDPELWREAKADARKELRGKHLLEELQQLKDNIGEGCTKCKRTKHGYCNRCSRELKGLDHLAGRIASLYTDKKERWKEEEP